MLDDAVKRVTHRVLRRYGYKTQDFEDGYHAVIERLIVRGRKMPAEKRPTTQEGMNALAARVTSGIAIDEIRARKGEPRATDFQSLHDDEKPLEIEDVAWDRVEVEDVARDIDRKMPDDIRKYLADMDDGLSQKEIAEKHGVKHQHVRDRVKKWRVDSRVVLAAAGIAFVVWFFGTQVEWNSAHQVGQGAPPDEPTQEQPQPPPEPRPGTPEARARAGQLRDEARAQCAAAQWKECLGSYDRAARLDPEGETPDVKAAHDKSLEEARKRER